MQFRARSVPATPRGGAGSAAGPIVPSEPRVRPAHAIEGAPYAGQANAAAAVLEAVTRPAPPDRRPARPYRTEPPLPWRPGAGAIRGVWASRRVTRSRRAALFGGAWDAADAQCPAHGLISKAGAGGHPSRKLEKAHETPATRGSPPSRPAARQGPCSRPEHSSRPAQTVLNGGSKVRGEAWPALDALRWGHDAAVPSWKPGRPVRSPRRGAAGRSLAHPSPAPGGRTALIRAALRFRDDRSLWRPDAGDGAGGPLLACRAQRLSAAGPHARVSTNVSMAEFRTGRSINAWHVCAKNCYATACSRLPPLTDLAPIKGEIVQDTAGPARATPRAPPMRSIAPDPLADDSHRARLAPTLASPYGVERRT